ncbi:MAG: ABC transporter ATP-binding protein [Chthoniobacteraceae bacterium]
MLDTAIDVDSVSKLYRLGEVSTGTLSHDLNRWWHKIRNKPDPYAKLGECNDRTRGGGSDYVWALKDVSFNVRKGEILGIIGRNGAGKSTLLKILSRVTAPTSGSIRVRGRIASLLEIGTGFHPELSGRENIFLNGAILGMRKAEIERKLDEIIDFSGCERYIDTPVKRYSSGMYVRLAFAVAAHLEPDILIVDEVLSVGDAEFQRKCLGKMGEVSRNGRTVLFVSHNLQAITTLTHTAILLSQGRLVAAGPTAAVVTSYLDGLKVDSPIYNANSAPDSPKVTRVEVETSEPNCIHVFGKALKIRFRVNSSEPVRGLCLSFQIVSSRQCPIVHIWTFDSERPVMRDGGEYEMTCVIPNLRLYMGCYTLKYFLSEPPGGRMFDSVDNICPFEVVMHNHSREFSWQPETCAYLECYDWKISKVV